MRWFANLGSTHHGDPSRLVVTVLRADGGGTAGAGFVLGPDTVLTCAHVVNDALGRPMLETRQPRLEEIPVVWDGGSERQSARLLHWVPPRGRDGGAVREGDDEWFGDLAVLRVDGPDGGLPTAPDRADMSADQEVSAWYGGGGAATLARLTVASLHASQGYLDGTATGMAIGPGYSGGPLWCGSERAVVGLVVAHYMPPRDAATGLPLPHSPQHLIRRSWAIPWQRVRSELEAVGAEGMVPPRSPEPDDPALLLLTEAIADILYSPNERADCAKRLAQACGVECGSDVTPPTPEEFASFLVTHPRALAVLSGILRRSSQPSHADRVLAAGSLCPVPRMLTPHEYAGMRKELRNADRDVLARIPEAVRAALPHVAAVPGGESLDALLDRLEALPGDGHSANGDRRVPALLRVLEYVGALSPPTRRAQLRMWADGVAQRLGIARSALSERRSDAQAWGRSVRDRSARMRVLVQVTRAERGRHRMRIWCDEGAGPRQVSTDSGVAYSATDGAREVLRVLDSLTPPADDERPPLVEVLVDRASLDLPVDEWAAHDPDEIVPGVLGVEFPLVVHCPELLRRHARFISHWRSRWSRLDSGKTLVVSESMDPDALYFKLVNQLDTVRVCVDVPPGPRDGIVQTCLALGIPVVVWDRGRDGASHLVQHMADVATRELPDGVRDYRANAQSSPPEFPGRPVLAWADADRTVPRLHLNEPQESA
ncbi:VMAP-C domain-containing protein [Streptomyces sp. NPDC002913]